MIIQPHIIACLLSKTHYPANFKDRYYGELSRRVYTNAYGSLALWRS